MVISKLLTGLKSIAISWKTSAASAIVYQAALEGVNFTTIASGFAQLSLRGKIKAVTLAIREQTAAFLATPIGMISAIALGIFAVVKVTDALTTSAAEAREQLGQIASSYKSNADEIKTLNDELTTTRDRINELKSKGKLSFTEASELERLNAENEKLKEKLKLLQDITKEEQKDAIEDFNTSTNERFKPNISGKGRSVKQRRGNIADYITEGLLDGNSDYLKTYEKQINDFRQSLLDLYDAGVDYNTADEETKKNIERIQKLTHAVMIAKGEYAEFWDSAYHSSRFSEARKAIEELGEVTAESLQELYNTNPQVKAFVDYLFSFGTTDAKNITDFLSLLPGQFKKIEESVKEAESSFKSIARTLSDGLDKLSNKKDILSEVKEELDSFGAISADNVSEILEQFPNNNDVQKAVAYYLSGLGTAQQVYDAMAKGYQNDLKLQAEKLTTQMQNDENYFNSLAKLHGDFRNFEVGNNKINISNAKNLATAKLNIEKELVKKIAENRKGLYEIEGKNLAQLEKYAREQVAKAPGSIERRLAQDFLSDVLKQKKIYDDAINEFNNLSLKGLNTSGFNATLSTDFDKDSGKTAAEKYFDKLKYQLETNQITQEQYLKELDSAYKRYYNKTADYLEDYAKYSQEVYDGFKDMYKEDLEAQKDAWEEKKDAVSEYYDKLREEIENTHDEEDYEKEQSEKRKEIFDLDMQIAELMRDGSEKSKARIAELEEERLKAEEELRDFETDKARENELSRLEKEQESEEKKIQDKIDGIQGQLDKLDEDTVSVRNAIITYAKAKGVTLNFAYASGTRSSVGGFGRINEKGIEMISAPDGNGNYIPMLPGSYVFSAKATEFLWKLATEHSLPQAMYNSIAKSIKTQSNTPSVNIAQPITITMGDVIIKGNADKQTVADIKKQQENTVRMVLQKIKELQK